MENQAAPATGRYHRSVGTGEHPRKGTRGVGNTLRPRDKGSAPTQEPVTTCAGWDKAQLGVHTVGRESMAAGGCRESGGSEGLWSSTQEAQGWENTRIGSTSCRTPCLNQRRPGSKRRGSSLVPRTNTWRPPGSTQPDAKTGHTAPTCVLQERPRSEKNVRPVGHLNQRAQPGVPAAPIRGLSLQDLLLW